MSAALTDNEHLPYGQERSARAEHLVEQAAALDDRPLLIDTLQELIQAREYAGQRDRILVPFARVLRIWDENPADFSPDAAHRLHRHFKWVSYGMCPYPGVPLATIERWLEEMATRYRSAGYGLHSVYAGRHHLALHLGDLDAAGKSFDDWVSSERDAMSDCEACERSHQGRWYQLTGRDTEALDTWRPVLDGTLRCRSEPHHTLAHSLLPLVRLGRLDEARANHLRGYRMVRGNPALRTAVGTHLEFAALTGNEPRGLEILADHAGWLNPGPENLADRRGFLEGVAVLLRRLGTLGYGDLPVPTPRAATATTSVDQLLPAVEQELARICEQFDRRNANTAVSSEMNTRISAQPLIAALPLGVRPPALPTPRVRSVPPGTGATRDDLIAEATRLDEARHPLAAEAWEKVAVAYPEPPPHIAGRIAQHRATRIATDDPAAGRADFLTAAEYFTAAGDTGRALVNRARAALAAGFGGDPRTAKAELTEIVRKAQTLDTPSALAVRGCDVRALFQLWAAQGEKPRAGTPSHSELETALRDLTADAEAADQPYHLASTLEVQAQVALATEAADKAQELLARAAEAFEAAGTPWEAARPHAWLGRIALGEGKPVAAEEHARAAARLGGDLLDPRVGGDIGRILAEACWRQGGREREAIDIAVSAAEQLDPIAPLDAARARTLAAFAYHRVRRAAEAVALVEAALPDLERYGEETEVVQARQLSGWCLLALGEPREAAQALLSGAEIAKAWPNQLAHAALAHDAGAALEAAGMFEEARTAYERAVPVWHTLHRPEAEIRAIRAAAWAYTKGGEPNWPRAAELLDQALEVAQSAGPDGRPIAGERAETQLQIAQLHQRWGSGDTPADAERGLAMAEAAGTGFGEIGEFDRSVRARLLAADLEARSLGRTAHAAARVRAVREECLRRGADPLVQRCDEILEELAAGRP